MTNEHTLIFETESAVPFTVDNATGIEKGALLRLSGAMSAIAPSTTANPIAGVAKGEKIASDGRTNLEVFMGGIFKATASGAITIGSPLVNASYPINALRKAPAGASGAICVGYALEAVGDTGTFKYRLRPGTGGAI